MRIAIVLLAVCCCLSAAGGESRENTPQPVAASRPGFNPKDVVRHRPARHEPSAVSRELSALDDGEFLIDTSITYLGAPSCPFLPAVAFDGDNFLVVWQAYHFDFGCQIYGARVTPEGTVLDTAGIKISNTATGGDPNVAFDGTNFFVVWTYGCIGSADVYGARVTPAGVVLDSAGIAIATGADLQGEPSLAFDGTNSLVVWINYRGRDSVDDVYGARVTPAGVVLDPAGIAIATGAGWQTCPALAFDSTNFLVVWQDGRDTGDIYGARVTPEGVVLDSSSIAIATAANPQQNPTLAFDGRNFLVVWADCCGWDSVCLLSMYHVYGARVTPAGEVLDTAGVAISTAASYACCPTVAFDGDDFFVVWEQYEMSLNSIYGARVTPAGEVRDTASILISTTPDWAGAPALGLDDDNLLAVWVQWFLPDHPANIYGTRVTPAGVVLDSMGIDISTAANWQYRPALAFDGENFLAVWEDHRANADSSAIYGARVTPGGTVLDTSGIPISTRSTTRHYPDAAFDDTNFLVVWENGYGIRGGRVSQTGVLLDPTDIVISAGSGIEPAVAFDGTNFLVVWEDFFRGHHIYGARVTPAGVVLDDTGIVISTAADSQQTPALAFDGTNFLVVWDNEYGARGARVSPAGVVLDSAGIAISTAPTLQLYPAVSFDGTNFLVVWVDETNIAWDCDLYRARVTPAGVVFDVGPVVSQVGPQRYPALARGSGSQVLLAYQGWAGTVGGKTYTTYRTWGKLDLERLSGIADTRGTEARKKNTATIVRGVLYLPTAASLKPQAASWLLDISGCQVMVLHPGANDVRALSPGVYFVREAQAQAQAVRKVVVTR